MLIFVAVAMALVSAYWLVLTIQPLAERRTFSAEDWARLEDDSLDLLARRDRLIEELRDIEFEASMGKIEDADLEVLRARYEDEALQLMGRLESEHEDFEERIAGDIDALLERVRKRAEAVAESDPADGDQEEAGT